MAKLKASLTGKVFIESTPKKLDKDLEITQNMPQRLVMPNVSVIVDKGGE